MINMDSLLFPETNGETSETPVSPNVPPNCPPFPYHPHHPYDHCEPFTLHEDFLHTVRRVNETIARIMRFEERTKQLVDEFVKTQTEDNNTFKETAKETYNALVEAVTVEIESFERDLNNYFRVNLPLSVETLFNAMHDDGRLADIIDEALMQTGIVTINSQANFEGVYPSFANGGIYRLTCDVVCVEDITISKPCMIFSNNGSAIHFTAGKLRLNAETELRGLKIIGETWDFADTDGVVNVHAKCKIVDCEIDGRTDMTGTTDSGKGGYGIALFEGADGTEIDGCYIHNVSNSFIESWHNNLYNGHPQVSNVKITNNKLVDSETGDGIAMNGNNILVANNSLNGKWENGFLIHPKNENGANCENVVFEGNTFDVTIYQSTKNGYGIAIREGDDKAGTSINCVVRNNIFNGWGNTTNGVEAVRIDETCRRTVVEGNVFPNKNTPARACCIRDFGYDTAIRNNSFDLTKGVYAIQKCGNGGMIVGNNIAVHNGCYAIVLDGANKPVLIMDNTIYDGSNSAVITVVADNVTIKRNTLNCKQSAISTNTTAVNTVVSDNYIVCGDTGVIAQNVSPTIANNTIISGKDGINVTVQCVGANVKNNDITIDTTLDTARDCIITSGKNVKINGNNLKVAGRNALQITSSASGECTVEDNVFPENSVIVIMNYSVLTYFLNNNFKNSTFTFGSNDPVIFDGNLNYDTVIKNGAFIAYNGYLPQRAKPDDGSENDVASKYVSLVKAHRLVVEDISETPYRNYALLSDGTWADTRGDIGELADLLESI